LPAEHGDGWLAAVDGGASANWSSSGGCHVLKLDVTSVLSEKRIRPFAKVAERRQRAIL
jgi:hypothetical protein